MTTKVVHIIDDNEDEREALKWLLLNYGYKPHSYSGARAFLKFFNDAEPAVILLDINMPDIDGLELLEILNREKCHTPILMITGLGTVPDAMKSIKLGAQDFIEKPFDNDVLLKAVEDAHSRAVEQYEATKKAEQIKQRLSGLTNREHQVFDHLTIGKTNKMISRELGISDRTVEVHRSHIMAKTGVYSLADLIKLRG